MGVTSTLSVYRDGALWNTNGRLSGALPTASHNVLARIGMKPGTTDDYGLRGALGDLIFTNAHLPRQRSRRSTRRAE